ncbi:hypothetical protein ACOMHN_040727 [Nucella lapillus]
MSNHQHFFPHSVSCSPPGSLDDLDQGSSHLHHHAVTQCQGRLPGGDLYALDPEHPPGGGPPPLPPLGGSPPPAEMTWSSPFAGMPPAGPFLGRSSPGGGVGVGQSSRAGGVDSGVGVGVLMGGGGGAAVSGAPPGYLGGYPQASSHSHVEVY